MKRHGSFVQIAPRHQRLVRIVERKNNRALVRTMAKPDKKSILRFTFYPTFHGKYFVIITVAINSRQAMKFVLKLINGGERWQWLITKFRYNFVRTFQRIWRTLRNETIVTWNVCSRFMFSTTRILTPAAIVGWPVESTRVYEVDRNQKRWKIGSRELASASPCIFGLRTMVSWLREENRIAWISMGTRVKVLQWLRFSLL